MHAVAALLVLLALLAQVDFCLSGSISFSTIEQCQPFTVKFSGGPMPTFPLSLTIVPFFAAPISIPIPFGNVNNATASGTAEVTFLPLYAGTQFIASLDDASGIARGMISDVMAVQKSNVTDCLPPKQDLFSTNFYQIKGPLNQCSAFNVTFESSQIKNSPTIRAFLPRSFSFPINATDTPPQPSSQEFMLDIFHGFQAVLLIDDGDGHQESTPLFTVGGDTSSPVSCFNFTKPSQSSQVGAASDNSNSRDSKNDHHEMSRTDKIIVGVVCGSVIVAVAIGTVYIIIRRRIRSLGDLGSAGSSTKSFIFTEDVDMGSSFMARVRSRVSQFWGSTTSRSYYRSYHDEEKSDRPYTEASSYDIIASPMDSDMEPKPHHRTRSDSLLSLEKFFDESYFPKSYRHSMSANLSRATNFDTVTFRKLPLPPYPAPVINPPPAARVRNSKPDAPLPALPRTPSSRYRSDAPTLRSPLGSESDISSLSGEHIIVPLSPLSQTRFSKNRVMRSTKKSIFVSSSLFSESTSSSSAPRTADIISISSRISAGKPYPGRVSSFPTSPVSPWGGSRTSD